MLNIIPGILSEKELQYFEEEDGGRHDFTTFANILDDALANFVLQYYEQDGKDPVVAQNIEKYVMPKVYELTLPNKMIKLGALEAVKAANPSALLTTNQTPEYLQKVRSLLQTLEDNYNHLKEVTPARTVDDFNAFKDALEHAVIVCKANGDEPMYPSATETLKANKNLFYSAHDKGHPTLMATVIKRHMQWLVCLRGLDYHFYMEEHNVSQELRRAF